MLAAIVIMPVRIMFLSMLLVLFPSIIDNVSNDSGNNVVIGDGGDAIFKSTEMMITL